MTPITSLFVYVVAIVIAFIFNDHNSDLVKLLESHANISLGPLIIVNDSSCNVLDFRLNHYKHADFEILFSNYASYMSSMSLFKLWMSQRSDQVFFGTLKLNDNSAPMNAIAKGPGLKSFEMFEKTINIATDIDTFTTNNQWTLLTFTGDSRSLDICSNDIKLFQSPLFYSFFNSVISGDDDIQARMLVEAWIAVHVNVEILVLKVLNGYRYVPNIYATCGRVYFVEDCGFTLQYQLNKMNLNLSNRLLVAIELLTLALELADGTAHKNYSFYLINLNANNIALQLDETSGAFLSLKVIDWSDVIIVVNNSSKKQVDDEMIHVSEHTDCGYGCLAYSKEEICQSRISDHNIYAVCKEFLSNDGRLLHEILDLDKKIKSPETEVKNLASLLNNCLWNFDVEQQYNNKKILNRFDTAKLIIKSIQLIYDFETFDITNNVII